MLRQDASTTVLALLVAIASAQPLAATFALHPAVAQSPSAFTLPSELPAGATLQVDGSSSMAGINKVLQERFQAKFPDTDVNLNYAGSAAALEALRSGTIDVAAIGRPLTEAEEVDGFVEVPVSRNKIAIVVGTDNPLSTAQSLTIEQFAQLFRGELTDWSEIGGTGAIRLIDRPDDSDTRQAFQNYPVFQNAPFETGGNATQLSEDSTDAMVQELGSDGIGYAIVDQVVDRSDVRIVPMHNVLPTDQRYPFSQPLGYVYRGTASPEVQAFLATAVAPENAAAIEAAREETIAPDAVAPVPVAAPSVTPATTDADPVIAVGTPVRVYNNRFPWWLWWLSLPLLGGLLWWLAGRGRDRDRDQQPALGAVAPIGAAGTVAAGAGAAGAAVAGAAVAGAVAATSTSASRIILVPRNCKEAYAYWEVPTEQMQELERQGSPLKLRIYDVTGIDLDRQPAHSMEEYDCTNAEPDRHIPIPVDDRDYIADLGYVTQGDRWLSLTRSTHVRVPACVPDADPLRATVTPMASPPSPTPIPAPTTGSALTAAGAAVAAVAATSASAARSFLGDRSDKPLEGGVSTPFQPSDPLNRIILVARDCRSAYAYWELSDDHRQALRRQGGRNIKLRIHDVTNIDLDHSPAHSTQEYDCAEFDRDRHVPIPVDDRDYLVELGYTTQDGRWLRAARSTHIHVPACSPSTTDTRLTDVTAYPGGNVEDLPQSGNLYGQATSGGDGRSIKSGVAAVADGMGDAVQSGGAALKDLSLGIAGGVAAAAGTAINAVSSAAKGDDRIILTSRRADEIYVYWELSEETKASARRQGGQQLALRIHDVTGITPIQQPSHRFQQFSCDQADQDRHITVPANGEYLAEIGYLAEGDRWFSLAKSAPLSIEAA